MAEKRRKAKKDKTSKPKNQSENKSEEVEFSKYKFVKKEPPIPPIVSNMSYSEDGIIPEEQELIDLIRKNYHQYPRMLILEYLRKIKQIGSFRYLYNQVEIMRLKNCEFDFDLEYSKEEKDIQNLQKYFGINEPDNKKNIKDSDHEKKLVLEFIF